MSPEGLRRCPKCGLDRRQKGERWCKPCRTAYSSAYHKNRRRTDEAWRLNEIRRVQAWQAKRKAVA